MSETLWVIFVLYVAVALSVAFAILIDRETLPHFSDAEKTAMAALWIFALGFVVTIGMISLWRRWSDE